MDVTFLLQPIGLLVALIIGRWLATSAIEYLRAQSSDSEEPPYQHVPVVPPPYATAVEAWRQHLTQNEWPEDVVWLFEDNLLLERVSSSSLNLHMSYQTTWSFPSDQDNELAYHYFAQYGYPIVFHAVGTDTGRSLSIMMSDDWFEDRGDGYGYTVVFNGALLFHAHPYQQLELVRVDNRWSWYWRRFISRVWHNVLSDFDFSMSYSGLKRIKRRQEKLGIVDH